MYIIKVKDKDIFLYNDRQGDGLLLKEGNDLENVRLYRKGKAESVIEWAKSIPNCPGLKTDDTNKLYTWDELEIREVEIKLK